MKFPSSHPVSVGRQARSCPILVGSWDCGSRLESGHLLIRTSINTRKACILVVDSITWSASCQRCTRQHVERQQQQGRGNVATASAAAEAETSRLGLLQAGQLTKVGVVHRTLGLSSSSSPPKRGAFGSPQHCSAGIFVVIAIHNRIWLKQKNTN